MIPIGNAARRAENLKERRGVKRTRSRPKQSRLPKKPKQEPLSKIIPGDHPAIFKKASEL